VVPASELAAARAEIAKLQRVLGKKTLENEILKEAVECAAAKKWMARSPLLRGHERQCLHRRRHPCPCALTGPDADQHPGVQPTEQRHR